MMEAGQDYEQLMSLTERKMAEENIVASLVQEWEELENIMMEMNDAHSQKWQVIMSNHTAANWSVRTLKFQKIPTAVSTKQAKN